MKALLPLAMLAGCAYHPPSGETVDAAPDAPGVCVSFATMLDTCALPAGAPVMLSGALTFDTNTGELFDGAVPITVDTRTLVTPAGEVKAILGSSVVLTSGTTITATGARPFAIVADQSIELDDKARIDVSIGGAGARSSCPDPAMRGNDRDGGSGGGGGGGFGAAGGTGGAGDKDGTSPSPGGTAGAASPLPAGPVGGCAGAAGGNDNNDTGGRGGIGGGAAYLAAGRRIDLATGAGIDAGGEGGRGGNQHGIFNGDAGGGGGGSGGMIVLESPTIASSGTLAANGGGGGEGSGGTNAGNDGQRGQFGTSRATGGHGNAATGGDGGDGGARIDVTGATVGDFQNGGGGGGGGSAGFIVIISAMPELGAVSPAPS